MTAPTIAVGLPVYDDMQGVMYTLQHLSMFHRPHISRIVIIDNNPGSADGQATRRFAESFGDWVRYVPVTGAVGTAAAKDAVFRHSDADVTVCMDAHVFLGPTTFPAVRDFYAEAPASDDLLYGVLVGNTTDDVIATEMSDRWSGNMWGVWHTDDRGRDPAGRPFPIWSSGGGWFATRTASWLGFHPAMRGFGGEEGYLAEKYARAGRGVWCLPGVRWWHVFDDALPADKKRKGDRQTVNQARNYAVGLMEIGVPLDRAAAEYAGKIDWEAVVKEAKALLDTPAAPTSSGCGCTTGAAAKAAGLTEGEGVVPLGAAARVTKVHSHATAADWYETVTLIPGSASDALPVLKALTGRATAVADAVAFTHPLRAAVAAGLGADATYRSYSFREAAEWEQLAAVLGDRFAGRGLADPGVLAIEPCDLFVWNRQRTADSLYRDLAAVAPQVSARIFVLGVGRFGARGDDGGPGLHVALVRFLSERPEWSVVDEGVGEHQEGFVVLSRDPADKPALPSLPEMAWSYSKAEFTNWWNGGHKLSLPMAEERLAHCWTCKMRTGNRCSACGCYLDKKGDKPGKVFYPEQGCPLGKWGPVDPKEVADASAD